MANKIGSLLVRIGADTSELLRGTKKSETALQKLGSVGKKAGLALAAGITAAAAALSVLTKRSFANVDALAKQADALDIETEKLAGLRHGATLAGVAQEALDKALQRQRKTLFDASKGLSTATDALDVLGLRTEDLLKLNTHEQFLTIADALSKVENSTLQAGVAQDIFGREGQKILNLTNQGREALEAYSDEAERLGIAVSRVDAAKIEQANDAMERAKQRLAGIGNVIAIELAPIIDGLSDSFVDSTGSAEGMSNIVRSAIDKIAVGVGIVADGFRRWKLTFAGIEFAALETSRVVVSAFEKIQTPIVSALEIAGKFNDSAREAAESWRGRLDGLTDSFENAAEQSALQLQAVINAEKPSERVAASIERWRENAQAAAEATAAAAKSSAAMPGASSGPAIDQSALTETEALLHDVFASIEEKQREATEKARQAMKERTELLHERFADERTLELEKHEQTLADLQEALELQAITEAEFRAAREELEREHQERLTQIEQEGLTARDKFERASFSSKVAMISGQLSKITSTVTARSKELFKINKAAALSEAAVALPSAVIKAVENAGGLPWGAIAGAATAAAGLARISEIKSAQFGGGTTPSASGTTASVGGQPIGQQSPTSLIRIEGSGDRFSRDQIRELIAGINEAVGRDGTRLVFQAE